MKVLVTGGAGFVGSHIVEEALRQGHQVVIVDDLSSGPRGNVHKDTLFCEVGIADPRVHEIIEREGVEAIIHQAAQVGVPSSLEDPRHDAASNIMGTINLLEAAKKYRLQKFVYASSAAIYGSPDYVPVDEAHPLRPMSFYGLSKKTGEEYVLMYDQYFDINAVCFRYANIFGPRQTSGEGSVVPVFLHRMLTGDPVTIDGDGNQTRDLIYVRDVARANVAALTSDARGTFNLSTNEEVTINHLFRTLDKLTGYGKEAVYGPPRPGDIYRSVLDNAKLAAVLDWKPETNFVDGLEETIAWWKTRIGE